ncbi:ABC transporter permease [Pseudoalteromonas denitrificans]|uniref:Duplicated orphan permease n=1 Tax=Pseudoalteromonas denitrificans DSM 6059 TaxID=1123010 RepID=A0A1I1RBJ8_9GAMM|nr:ABC transporter permease [Pseudoalteromonas denitrificans]SFD28923.1 duplicated orphan permease [Pseudoalteromonas denitrificans DSM 6059]
MSQFIYQQKQAWFSLKQKPSFVASVLITMGTTLGALLCILTLAYILIFKPLPYPEQSKLYTIEHNLIDAESRIDGRAFTYPNLMHLYQNQTVFSDAALLYYDARVLTSKNNQPTLSTTFVTPKWFELLNAKMVIGRSFEVTELMNTFNPVAVLSYDTWQKEFNLDPNILNKKVEFIGISYRIVGVIEKSFIEPQLLAKGLKTQVYLPWDYNSISEQNRKEWGNDDGNLTFIGKLGVNKTVKQINQSLTSLINDNWQKQVSGRKFFKDWSIGIKVHDFKSVILGDSENTIYLLLAGVIGLVLIACSNIANLFISRTAEQQRELAIHASVGATQKKLFYTILSQTGLLMLLSVICALVLANLGFYILQNFLSEQLPRVDELAINVFTLCSAIGCVVLFALFFAYLSSKMINYHALNLALQSSGKGTGIQVSKQTRKTLVITQVAIVTALVFVNIILFKDSIKTINQPSGFNIENMSHLVLGVSPAKKGEQDSRAAALLELRKLLLSQPEIEAVSQSTSPLMRFGTWALMQNVTDKRYTPGGKYIDHEYFKMIEQPLIEGDFFNQGDVQNNNPVMIVNDIFAKQLAPNGSALGMMFNGDMQVIGVVKGVQLPGQSNIRARAYYVTSYAKNMMMLKFKPGQDLSRTQVVALIKEASSQLTLFGYSSLNKSKEKMLFTEYTTAITSASLAILTIFLAAIGLYGILSYSTQMRQFEIGTRLAIGAQRNDLIKMIIKDNAPAILWGFITSFIILLFIFVGLSDVLITYINAQLLSILAITLFLIGFISLFACYWPLRTIINRPAIYALKGSD